MFFFFWLFLRLKFNSSLICSQVLGSFSFYLKIHPYNRVTYICGTTAKMTVFSEGFVARIILEIKQMQSQSQQKCQKEFNSSTLGASEKWLGLRYRINMWAEWGWCHCHRRRAEHFCAWHRNTKHNMCIRGLATKPHRWQNVRESGLEVEEEWVDSDGGRKEELREQMMAQTLIRNINGRGETERKNHIELRTHIAAAKLW